MPAHLLARVQPAIAMALLFAAPLASSAPYTAGVRYALPTADTDSRGAFRARLRVVDDLNSDGRRDLAIGMAQFSVQVLLSGPARTFTQASFGNPTTSALASGDFKVDGKVDLVVGNETSFTLLVGDGSGQLTPLTQVSLDVLGPHACVEDLVAGDFDGDGKLDVAVIDADPLNNFRTYANGGGGSGFYRNSVAVAYGRGDGTFDTSRPRIAVSAYPQHLIAADFQSDSRPELIVASAESKTLQIASNSTASPLGSQYGIVSLHAATDQADIIGVAVGALDNDIKLDLAVLFYSHEPDINGRRYFLNTYRNTSSGTQPFAYTSALTALAFDAAPGSVALANVSGDGNVDAIVSTRRDDRPGVAIYPGNGTGGFGAADPLPERFAGEDVVVADFDNDSKMDIAVVDRSSHAVVVYWHL